MTDTGRTWHGGEVVFGRLRFGWASRRGQNAPRGSNSYFGAVFNTISGSNGLMRCAIVLSKFLNEHSVYTRSRRVAFSRKAIRGARANYLERVAMVRKSRPYGLHLHHRHPGFDSQACQKGGEGMLL